MRDCALLKHMRPGAPDLTFGCEPVFELVARPEPASFGAIVSRFSDHGVSQSRPGPCDYGLYKWLLQCCALLHFQAVRLGLLRAPRRAAPQSEKCSR